jgi:hypothetical protein
VSGAVTDEIDSSKTADDVEREVRFVVEDCDRPLPAEMGGKTTRPEFCPAEAREAGLEIQRNLHGGQDGSVSKSLAQASFGVMIPRRSSGNELVERSSIRKLMASAVSSRARNGMWASACIV